MLALILISGGKAFGIAVAAAAGGVASGYAFRGKENKAIKAVGQAVGSAAASAANAAADAAKKV